MKINKDLEKRENIVVKIETFYDIGTNYPYVVKFFVGENVRQNTFSTRFFAIRKAKQVAKVLGINPDLTFKPIIGK